MKIFFIIAVTVRDAFLYNEIVVLRPKVESEQKAKGMMAQGFKMSDSQWEYTYRCFELMNLDILAHLFSADGVLKRGSWQILVSLAVRIGCGGNLQFFCSAPAFLG